MSQVPDPLELADKLSQSNGSSIKMVEEEPSKPTVTTASTDLPPTPRTLEATLIDQASTSKSPVAKRTAKPPKASPAVASMLPAGERVHVYLRRDGKRVFCDDYAYEDFQGSGSMERFLKRHVVPKYGYGSFDLYLQKVGVDSLLPLGSVGIAEPTEPASKEVSALKDLLEAQKRMTEDAAKNTPSLIDNVKALAEMKTIFSEEKGGMRLDPALLLLMQQGQKKDESPILDVLSKLVDRLEKVEKTSATPMPLPPPPPPPPPDRTPELLLEMMRQQTEVTRTMMMEIAKLHQKPERDPIRELSGLAELVRSKDDDKLSIKEMIGLLPTFKEMLAPKTETKGGLAELMEQFRMIQMLKQEIVGDGGGSMPGFWEFATTLVNSRLGEQIGEAIALAQAKGNPGAPQLPKPPKRKDSKDDEELVIPQSFAPYANAINEAIGNPQKLAPAIIYGIQHLGRDKQFRPVIFQILTHIKNNEKKEALTILGDLLRSLAEAEAIKMEAAKEAMKVFNVFWLPICRELGFKHDKDPMPYQPPQQVQPPQVQNQPQPDDDQSEEEEADDEIDEEEGEEEDYEDEESDEEDS